MMLHRCVLSCLLALGLCTSASAQLREIEGVVDRVQRLDASAVADESFLILSLVGERHFLLPEESHLPAAPGVLVAVDYLQPEQDGDLPQACRVQVLGMPITVDGEEVLQRASRPFEVYRNPRAECQTDS
jgi:hypothetical protein